MRFGCLRAPLAIVKSLLSRSPAEIETEVQTVHVPDQGVLIASVVSKEIGNTPEKVTIHLQFEPNFIGLETFSLPLHENPNNETASWHAVKEGERVKIRYRIGEANEVILVMAPEPIWFEGAG